MAMRSMQGFVYHCPNTRLKVQGWIIDDPAKRNDEFYEAVKCTACGQTHVVSPKTGKVLGEDDK